MSNFFTIAMVTAMAGGFAFGAFFALPDEPEAKEFFAAQEIPKTLDASGGANRIIEISGEPLLVEIADTEDARAQGLSGRSHLAENDGLLLVFEANDYHGIWMKNMRFPLDLFWIRDGRVVHVEENVSSPVPGALDFSLPIYRPSEPARMVLETIAGFAARYNIRAGDRVRTGFEETPTDSLLISTEQNGSQAQGTARVLEKKSEPDQAGFEFTISALRKRLPQGENFTVGSLVSETGSYKKYDITYQSGDLTISGVMNVPKGKVPTRGFPTLILNHGLIHPSIYFSGRGSKREQDFFARHGYVTIHPDYRGHAGSDPNPEKHHDFYVGYSEDAVNIVDALFNANLDFIDEERIGMWGHSMGGGIAARVTALEPRVRAYVLFAPISADAEENFYELSQSEIAWLRKTYGAEGASLYRMISPITYFSEVTAPVQIHHGTLDKDVPIRFSETMFETLRRYGKQVEFFRYPGEPHEFVKDWPLAAERALQFFDLYVKSDR